MFRKILIANRGEIAVRVARTARRMGVATVAVYSDADAGAPHVRACDEAARIGTPAPADSYLRAERIIDAAKKTGAEAIHPGYGFLSENDAFADALEKAGIVFIGPTAKTIRAMGSKSAAKDLMQKAGVPTTPGYQGEDQSVATFKREAKRIGYPVLLKATAGGGGKGMRMVAREEDLADALASAQREAKSAFGDDRFLVEKYLPRARHVEVQIFGDGAGEVVHFFERDCSVQRRHQKIIEEAPAPRLPAKVRAKLHEAGVNAGKAVDYRGAGTVEFLYDGADSVFFMEMNTRLQVEHPVTEAITGVDLVEWQLRVAAGEKLPLKQSEIKERGHAFEARLYAENPDQNFAPSIGTLTTLRLPASARIDSGVEEGQTITPYYDPMIAKIITSGADRAEALAKMASALRETRVAGLETNARFLHALSVDPDFAKGDVSTRYIDEHEAALFGHPPAGNRVLAAALFSTITPHPEEARSAVSKDGQDPWASLAGFRLNKPAKQTAWIEIGGAPALARMIRNGDRYDVTIEPQATATLRKEKAASTEKSSGAETSPPSPVLHGRGVGGEGKPRRAESLAPSPLTPLPQAGEGDTSRTIIFSMSGEKLGDDLQLTVNGERFTAFVAPHHNGSRVWIGADFWDVAFPDPLSGALGAHSAEGSLTAPMPGVVTLVKAKPGEDVTAGAVLLVMEAMKMEHAIKAPHDGRIKSFRFKAGDQVKDGDLLVEFEESA